MGWLSLSRKGKLTRQLSGDLFQGLQNVPWYIAQFIVPGKAHMLLKWIWCTCGMRTHTRQVKNGLDSGTLWNSDVKFVKCYLQPVSVSKGIRLRHSGTFCCSVFICLQSFMFNTQSPLKLWGAAYERNNRERCMFKIMFMYIVHSIWVTISYCTCSWRDHHLEADRGRPCTFTEQGDSVGETKEACERRRI